LSQARFFANAAEFRSWLEENHATETELLVGFHRAATGRPSMSWAESVDEALCFGWIDGVRRGIDAASYTIRFTPRKRASRWSAVNVRNVERLSKLGLMRPAGIRAAGRRDPADSGYTYNLRPDDFEGELSERFRAAPAAYGFFLAQAPSHRKQVIAWVTQAKREETRLKRLAMLIEASAAGRRLDLLSPRRASTG
jgi:uncharacterized protein YdeI (YjbR/CyaY-like superfamily)